MARESGRLEVCIVWSIFLIAEKDELPTYFRWTAHRILEIKHNFYSFFRSQINIDVLVISYTQKCIKQYGLDTEMAISVSKFGATLICLLCSFVELELTKFLAWFSNEHRLLETAQLLQRAPEHFSDWQT